MSEYRTKVMKPTNLKGLAAAREAIEEAIVEAEQKQVTGDITVSISMKDGGSYQVKSAVNKTVRMPG